MCIRDRVYPPLKFIASWGRCMVTWHFLARPSQTVSVVWKCWGKLLVVKAINFNNRWHCTTCSTIFAWKQVNIVGEIVVKLCISHGSVHGIIPECMQFWNIYGHHTVCVTALTHSLLTGHAPCATCLPCTSSNFHTFNPLKEALAKWRYHTDEEVRNVLWKWLSDVEWEFFSNSIEKHVILW